jgi:hypothetical protein
MRDGTFLDRQKFHARADAGRCEQMRDAKFQPCLGFCDHIFLWVFPIRET